MQLKTAPFSRSVLDVITHLSSRISLIESARLDVKRRERAELDSDAQVLQQFSDKIFFTLAGLSTQEAEALEDRLSTML